jgi:hypothetical protein
MIAIDATAGGRKRFLQERIVCLGWLLCQSIMVAAAFAVSVVHN